MRVAQERRVRFAAQKSQSMSLPAPIGGLNARDSEAQMPETDASLLENWFPTPTNMAVRDGYIPWSTFTGVCQTVLVYNGLSATKVFPCVNNASTYSIYDGTSAGALSSAVVGGGGSTIEALTSCRFDYVNFGTAGGQYLFAVNGVDVPLRFDGTTWIASGLTGGTPAAYQSIGIFLNRLWVFEKNSFIVHYWAVDAVTGAAATALNLGSVFKLGGHLSALISLTDFGTAGLVDYMCFLSSEGELVAYTGTDPSTIATWTKAAQIKIGRPVTVGNRTWCKAGADAFVLCTDGVYPLRRAVTQDKKVEQESLSDKIRPLLAHDIGIYGGKYGWQIIIHPKGNKLIINVPTSEDVSSYQYVMNSQFPSWTKFVGWTAFNFAVAQDTLYFGGRGVMVKADTSANDGVAAIRTKCRQAWNYLGQRGTSKQLKLMRPIIESTGDYELIITADADFRTSTPTIYRTVPGGSGDPWGAGVWDTEWSGPPVTSRHWYGVGAVGTAIAPYVSTITDGVSLNWAATDIVSETGGVLG
jgi:hypothetical protein